MGWISRSLFFVAITVLSISTARAQGISNGPGVLEGHCIFPDGSPASGVLVQVFDGSRSELRDFQSTRLPGTNLRVTDAYHNEGPSDDSLPFASTVSDRNGEWVIRDLATGPAFLVTAQLVSFSSLALQAAASFVDEKWGSPRDVPLTLQIVNTSTSTSPPPFSANASTIYYATTRSVISAAQANVTYADALGDGSLRFGQCRVELDRLHRITCMEMSRADMQHALHQAVEQSTSRQLLVFVHGYNVGFVDSVRAAGTLSGGTGRATLTLDWASAHDITKYLKDEGLRPSTPYYQVWLF